MYHVVGNRVSRTYVAWFLPIALYTGCLTPIMGIGGISTHALVMVVPEHCVVALAVLLDSLSSYGFQDEPIPAISS